MYITKRSGETAREERPLAPSRTRLLAGGSFASLNLKRSDDLS